MHSIQKRLHFLYKFTRYPKQIGSITPSSSFLARRMVSQIDWSTVRYVAELGSGTGAITKYMKQAAVPGTKTLLFECDPFMRDQLVRQYPDCSCYPDANQLLESMRSAGIGQLDCIISGLPFFNFPQEMRDSIIDEVLQSLKPRGLFVAFQYSKQMRIKLSLYFDVEALHFVPLNMPPAFIYVCRKREGSLYDSEVE
ncbi:methyltransferase type 11 [Paenibacillus alvei TS-15]|uniref:Methyltransferase type 11 n=1 Tax=Paenibacillus alvei TS-15 TaxID=1117108 RepID=S9TZG0_PAEAL|nr:methyltransferase type 11 [Paenibacillus alvei]EPY03685.1 methyltransferase type 11 [Paenibacillus alvei TS-15]